MLKYSLIGALLIAVTVVIHAAGTTGILQALKPAKGPFKIDGAKHSLKIIVSVVLILCALHVVEIVLWALTYLAILPSGELGSLEEAVYFSFVTFTTLGYGDITLSEGRRLLSGIEALNGILLVGWTTAMLFAVVNYIWQSRLTPGSKS